MQHEDKFSLEVIAQTYLLFVSKIINQAKCASSFNGMLRNQEHGTINTPYTCSLKIKMYNNQEHEPFYEPALSYPLRHLVFICILFISLHEQVFFVSKIH